MALPRFEIIDDEAIPQVKPSPRPENSGQGQDAAFSALMLALKAMSQKTVIALSKLAALAMVGSVFWLFMSIPNPSTNQIVWGGMYSVFVTVTLYVAGRFR
jgi:ABC-type siderophore export system fused ATPase/permease subunit